MKATLSYGLRDGQTRGQLLIDIMTAASSYVNNSSNSFALNGLLQAVELENGGCLIMPHVQLNDNLQVAQGRTYYSQECPGEPKRYYVADIMVTMIAPDDELSHTVVDTLKGLYPKYTSNTELSLEDFLRATSPPPKQRRYGLFPRR